MVVIPFLILFLSLQVFPASSSYSNITISDNLLSRANNRRASSCLGFPFTDTDIGSFGLDAGKYCSFSCGRSIPGVTCCQPSKPDDMGVKFLLFSNSNSASSLQLNWRDSAEKKYFSSGKKVVFIIHGFMKTRIDRPFMKDYIQAFLSQDYEVVLVDWVGGNQGSYPTAIANARVVGAMVGRAVLNWDISSRTLLSGFSLGGPVAGEAGSFVKVNSGGRQEIAECHALDPAGPNFDGCSSSLSLNQNSCKLVQVIHTGAQSNAIIGSMTGKFGSYQKNGHCDWWINCGHDQSGTLCDRTGNGLGRLCSHGSAVQLYIELVKQSKSCSLPAYDCPTCGRNPSCKRGVSKNPSSELGMPLNSCRSNMNANYYVSVTMQQLKSGKCGGKGSMGMAMGSGMNGGAGFGQSSSSSGGMHGSNSASSYGGNMYGSSNGGGSNYGSSGNAAAGGGSYGGSASTSGGNLHGSSGGGSSSSGGGLGGLFGMSNGGASGGGLFGSSLGSAFGGGSSSSSSSGMNGLLSAFGLGNSNGMSYSSNHQTPSRQ